MAADLIPTRYGRVRGIEDGSVRVFHGIPYAKPPVGARRFGAPEKPAPGDSVRDATRFGSVCPQPRGFMERLAGIDRKQSADCLYLNIWSPPEPAGPLPVLVWHDTLSVPDDPDADKRALFGL